MAFRKWKRPTVKQGGALNTPIGLLAIDEVSIVTSVSDFELIQSGYEDRDELQKELSKSTGNTLFRIKFHLSGEDPHISLRNKTNLSSEELLKLNQKIVRFNNSKIYPGWATKVLKTIQQNPGESAASISEAVGYEKDWLKPSIRKLKELGLTINLEIGYSISPRGNAYLQEKNR
jgi:hypothetical protein